MVQMYLNASRGVVFDDIHKEPTSEIPANQETKNFHQYNRVPAA